MSGVIASLCPAELPKAKPEFPPLPTAICNANSTAALASARLACEHGYIEPVLIGDCARIRESGQALDWDLAGVRCIAAEDAEHAAAIAVALARGAEVAGIMKGDLHTHTLLRAVIDRESGIRTDRRLSHVFHIAVPHLPNAICVTDAVINVQPSFADKVDIARNAALLLHALGVSQPRIAVLSGIEQATAAMPSSIDAANLARLAARGEIDGAIVDGPLAFDIAVSARAAAVKGYESGVSGRADVLLVPTLEAGNILYKSMVHFLGATAAGIVLGARVPIMLTSRSDTPVSRLASAALAAAYCRFERIA